MNGLGDMVFANGNKYSGQWQDDDMHGNGFMIYVLGNRSNNVCETYEGEWIKGRQGTGTYTYFNGVTEQRRLHRETDLMQRIRGGL